MYKKIISAVLAVFISVIYLPCAAAEDTVTESDVKAAMDRHLLINNQKDYELYINAVRDVSEDIIYYSPKDIKKYLDPGNAYLYYSIYADKNGNYFIDKDSDTKEIASGLCNEYNKNEHCYVYRDKINPGRNGLVYIGEDLNGAVLGFNLLQISLNETALLFDCKKLAEIINENNIGIPEDIRYVDNADVGNGNPVDYLLIYVKTDKGEYVITDVQYTAGELTSYLLLDKKEFIECMKGNISVGQAKAYEMLEVKEAPVFTDISNDRAVDLLARMGIVSGYGDGLFGGDKSVTRAEAAKMIALAAAEKENNLDQYLYDEFGDTDIFTDVGSNHWAKKYILYGCREGYISGIETMGKKTVISGDAANAISSGETERVIDTYAFHPDDTVTEQQLAKMLVSVIDDHGDTMAKAEGGYPYGYVSVAVRMGLCKAAADKPATRLTAAHMIKNALDAKVMKAMTANTTDIRGNSKANAQEMVYTKSVYYNLDWNGRRVKLSGKIAASSDTDYSLREKEVRFIVGQDTDSRMRNFKEGDEIILLTEYSDIKNYVNMDCEVYIETIGGNLAAIMAEV